MLCLGWGVRRNGGKREVQTHGERRAAARGMGDAAEALRSELRLLLLVPTLRDSSRHAAPTVARSRELAACRELVDTDSPGARRSTSEDTAAEDTGRSEVVPSPTKSPGQLAPETPASDKCRSETSTTKKPDGNGRREKATSLPAKPRTVVYG